MVLTRRKNGIKRLRNHLHGAGVEIETFHSLKGLENEIVFISQMQDTFAGLENEEEISQERRLIYMAMTRARSNLYLCYEGAWPNLLKGVLEYVN